MTHAASAGGPIVGVLGGMGPGATADFYAKLVRATPAATDQDHLRTLIWSDPSISDRTEALLFDGASPLPQLVSGLRLLEDAGAALIAMPCSTAHAYLPELRRTARVPIVSMVEATVDRLGPDTRSGATVGLLATSGTVCTGLYQQAFGARGVRCLVPSAPLQEDVMQAVRLVKAGRLDIAGRALEGPAAELVDAGAQTIVAACTELPLVLGAAASGVGVFDATAALVEDVLALAAALRYEFDKESTCGNAFV
ncbi:cysteate racemase [Salinispora mooreana]|uniref:aspartate/glutamate racemase family protein n=1 Tax=Salinispora mooreana TaxID=999545 RepID=UPI00037F8B68|nr:amino acid racemase [Salinispora mooreana]